MDAPQALQLILLVILLLVVVISAYTDIAYGKLYNWCTVPAIVLGFFGNFLLGHALENLWLSQIFLNSIFGFFLGFGIFFILFLIGGFGAGDMKLMGAIGALMGWRFALAAIIYSSFVGAMMALGVLIWHGKFFRGILDSIRLLFTLDKSKYAEEKKSEEALLTIPYGLAISVGTLWTLFLQKFWLNF